MLWNLESNRFKLYEIIPWFEISRSWSQPNRYETIYYKVYTIEWFGYKFETLKEISYEEWVKL